MSLNSLTLSGKLKNVRDFSNGTGTMVVAQLTQHSYRETMSGEQKRFAKFTIPVVIFDQAVAKAVLALDTDAENYTPELMLAGSLNTRYDRRPGVENADRQPPRTQVVVSSIDIA
jgi:hypothetical protein